jgi:hypothetical protein
MNKEKIDEFYSRISDAKPDGANIAFGLCALAYALVYQSDNQAKMQQRIIEENKKLNERLQENE